MENFYKTLLIVSFTLFFANTSVAQTNDKLNTTTGLKEELKLKTYDRLKSINKLKGQNLKNKQIVNLLLKDSLENGKRIYLKTIDSRGIPAIYTTYNYDGAVTVGNNLLKQNNESLNYFGEGITIGEWDGGAITKHQDFDTRTTVFDTQNGISGHATHVAGTLIGSGSVGKQLGLAKSEEGMANKATLRDYYWDEDDIEMVNEAGNNGMIVSNHSYGLTAGVSNIGLEFPLFFGYDEDDEDFHYGLYSEFDAIRDAIVYNYPHYLPVWAAGNDGVKPGIDEGQEHYVIIDNQFQLSTKARKGSCPDGYDCIPWGNAGKNMLTVGSIASTSYFANPSDYVISSFSSKGPTDDGRIKPDIVAPGEGVLSTSSLSGYAPLSGTSMATPTVTGNIALMQEAAKIHLNKNLKAATVKALVTNTAREAGNIGPDYHFGWGVLDAFAAVKTIEGNPSKKSVIKELTLRNGREKTINIKASGGQPLKVTVAWTDLPGEYSENPVLNDDSVKLVNDLDIRVYYQSEIHEPWVLDPNKPSLPATRGDNVIDNIEQIVIENPVKNAKYKVVISHKGNLVNNKQDYSIVATGLFTETNEVAVKSVSKKETLESYITPGVYAELIGDVMDPSVMLNYQLVAGDETIVFEGNASVMYDANSEQSFFLPFGDSNDSPVETGKHYKVIVTVNSDSDTDKRDNTLEIPFAYFVEHVLDSEDLFKQNFDGNHTKLVRAGYVPERDLTFGWEGSNNTFYSLTTRTGGPRNSLSIQLNTNESNIVSNPIQVAENETYQLAYWLRTVANGSTLGEAYSIDIEDALSGEKLQTIEIAATGDVTSNFNLYKGIFTSEKDQYIKVVLTNSLNEPTLMDDFSISFENSTAVIPLVVYYVYNDLAGQFIWSENVTSSTFNTFNAQLYDACFRPISSEDSEGYDVNWNITGMNYEFIGGTNEQSDNPKIRFIDDRGQANVQAIVNSNKSSNEYNVVAEPPHVDYLATFNFTFLSTRSGIDNVAYDLQNREAPSFGLFLHNAVGIAPRQISFPVQTSVGVSANTAYNTRYITDPETGVVVLNPETRIEKRYFTKEGNYQFQAKVTDSYTDGDWYNDLYKLSEFNVNNQFKNINSLGLEKEDSTFILNWKNPDFFYMESMSFTRDSDELVEYIQLEGQEKLNWRIQERNPRLSINNTFSLVSESIDEETLLHEDVDNWFFLKNANRAKFKYFTFLASMGVDFPEDEYEVYFLDKTMAANPNSPTVDDFLHAGVLLTTEAMGDLDEETIYPNYTVKKVVDIEALGLKNKDVYIAFRHNTRQNKNGSFLSIDLLRFQNVLDSDKTIYDLSKTGLFDVANKADLDWMGLNPNVYPIKGYEISIYDYSGNGRLVDFVEDKNIESYKMNEDLITSKDAKIGVKLMYDVSHKVLTSQYFQNLDTPELAELFVDIQRKTFPQEPTEFANAVTLFPNPVRGSSTYLRVNGPYVGMAEYQVVSMTGDILVQGNFMKRASVAMERINAAGLGSGSYVLRIVLGNEIQSINLIRERN